MIILPFDNSGVLTADRIEDFYTLDPARHSLLRFNRALTMAQRINGLFTCTVNIRQPGWQYRSNDFITYENANRRTVAVCAGEEKLREIGSFCGGSRFDDPYLRPHEPGVLVHSTTDTAWRKIRRSGRLYSFYALSREYDPALGLGYYFLEEPEDYAHYVMLCEMDNPVGELVVASRDQGRLLYDVNARAGSGVRLYIDADRLAADGLLVRDGVQYKVEQSLDLQKYLLLPMSAADIPGYRDDWTVKQFMQRADAHFFRRNLRERREIPGQEMI